MVIGSRTQGAPAFRVRRGIEKCHRAKGSSTSRYGAEVTHAILPGKARTTFNKRVPVPETDTDMSVKMRTTCTWTERPYEASLFPGIGFGPFLRSLGGRRRRPPSGGARAISEIPLWKS
ncbi:Cytochrome b reductase 1 (mitochondrion) [Quillaja saponaria]|uniref:Cytochrome b reductase 1 n=2 Tax=Quillaja saponaria TaxID=32244 RepID=A0AAD7P3T5_QUISA|nr:Cytochrome b reductase 1 [Quillaja saponaria]